MIMMIFTLYDMAAQAHLSDNKLTEHRNYENYTNGSTVVKKTFILTKARNKRFVY